MFPTVTASKVAVASTLLMGFTVLAEEVDYGDRHLYLLSHLAGPDILFLKITSDTAVYDDT